jgi:hypothetical protein
MNRKLIQRLLLLTCIVVVGLVILIPVFRSGFLVTDDADWMIIRLSAFFQNLREGQVPVRFLSRLNFSYGYPVSNFLYPGFLYIGSILHILGLSFQNSIEAIIIGSVLVGALALFLWLRNFFDDVASTIGAVSFLFMPYLLYDIYKRGSVGELLSISVCIVTLYAIETKARFLVPIAVALLVISHNTLAIFFIPVLLCYIAIKQHWDLLVPFFIGLGMSSFFFLPILMEKSLVLFSSVSVSDPASYFPVSTSIIVYSLPFIFAALIVGLVGKNIYTKERIFFIALIFLSAFFALGASSLFWKNALFIQYVQFPYRFFALWCFAAPWCIAMLSDRKKGMKLPLLAIAAVVVLALFSFSYQRSQSVNRPEGFYTTNEATTTVGNEYMPKWVSVIPTKRADNRFVIFTGQADVEEHHVNGGTIDITVHAKEDSVLQINTIYYPGWGAVIDNKQAVISYNNPEGVMRLMIPAGDHDVYMAFRETVGRFIADLVSVTFFIIYLVYGFTVCIVKKRHV